MVRLFDTVGWMRERARQLEGYQDAAARAFLEAADRMEADLRAELQEPLSIHAAAAQYGWNYEALRRKVASQPGLRTSDGRVTRATMEALGEGRGPRAPSPSANADGSVERGGEQERAVMHAQLSVENETMTQFDKIKRAATAARSGST